jgi:hypothetical protein
VVRRAVGGETSGRWCSPNFSLFRFVPKTFSVAYKRELSLLFCETTRMHTPAASPADLLTFRQ